MFTLPLSCHPLKVYLRCDSICVACLQDYDLKFGLLDDVFTVIDMEAKLGGPIETTIGGFDLIYNNGQVLPDKSSQYSSRLGNHVDRERQLKALYARHNTGKKPSKAAEKAAERPTAVLS